MQVQVSKLFQSWVTFEVEACLQENFSWLNKKISYLCILTEQPNQPSHPPTISLLSSSSRSTFCHLLNLKSVKGQSTQKVPESNSARPPPRKLRNSIAAEGRKERGPRDSAEISLARLGGGSEMKTSLDLDKARELQTSCRFGETRSECQGCCPSVPVLPDSPQYLSKEVHFLEQSSFHEKLSELYYCTQHTARFCR